MIKTNIKYIITLEHDDFISLVDALRKCNVFKLINWDAARFICEHTTIKDYDL